MSTSLPAPVIEKHGGFMVVRDDLLPGGTKRRALQPWMSRQRESEFIYASPAFGAAQVALAYSAAACGKRATIFVAKRNVLHPRTKLAEDVGAQVYEVPCGYLSVVQARAREYAKGTAGTALLPFGLDIPELVTELTQVARLMQIMPSEVWSVVSSGVLSRSLQAAWPSAKFYGVQVGHEPTGTQRGRASVVVAPEKYERPAKFKPPFPSYDNYDAKVWQFIVKRGTPGSLFWNVA